MSQALSGHPNHTLGELLADNATTAEKAKAAARSAPVVVIAIMAHVVVLAVLAMTYIHTAEKADATITVSGPGHPLDKIDIEPPKTKEVTEPEMPVVDSAIPVEPEDPNTFDPKTATDDYVNPEATTTDKRGMATDDPNPDSDLWCQSNGGIGLARAIGTGAGSAAGGGVPRGSPNGGSLARFRRTQLFRPTDTIKPVSAALEWLRRHQSPDGSWSSAGYMENCDGKRGAACTGRGSAVYDIGVTGLALLAFEGLGHHAQDGTLYGECVKKGLKFLKEKQDPEGCFGSRGYDHFTYAQACATIAMCEGYSANKQSAWRVPAQKAVDFCQLCRNPYKAWRYGMKPGDNDSSVTGWMLMAMHAAKDADLVVDDHAMKEALGVIEMLTDEDTGRTGYTKKGELPVRRDGTTAWPASESESLTAVAMCSRIFCNAGEGNPAMKKGAELLSKRLPVWDVPGGKIDMYYWYYGTLAMFQIGGADWERWNNALKPAVINTQLGGTGCNAGSWDPIDPWGEEGGRVYSTAVMALCLEVYYRYPRVFGAKRAVPATAPVAPK